MAAVRTAGGTAGMPSPAALPMATATAAAAAAAAAAGGFAPCGMPRASKRALKESRWRWSSGSGVPMLPSSRPVGAWIIIVASVAVVLGGDERLHAARSRDASQ